MCPTVFYSRGMSNSAIPTIALNNARTIPQFGVGTWQVPPGDTERVVAEALDLGYRHVDTAQMYENEEGVGAAIANSGLARDDIFVTSKLNNGHHKPADADRSLDESLAKLGIDQLDLFLIHWPLPTQYDGDYVSTWEAMTSFVKDGRCRSVGVSNFQSDHLERIIAETGQVPVVNQVEAHPWFNNNAVRKTNSDYDVRTQAWSPLAAGRWADEDVLATIADKHGKSPAQVTLRWAIERGDIIFPKSLSRDRLAANIDIFDFSLDGEDMEAIAGLHQGESGRKGPNPDVMDYIG